MLNAAEFGSPPNALQVAKLTRRMRGSGIQVGDLENSDDWKDKHPEWWEEQGAVFVERLQEVWKARAAGGGAMTDNMLKGKYLSVPEATYVVQHESFAKLVKKLEAEDWSGVRLLTKESSRFGQLVSKGALYFRELGGSVHGPPDEPVIIHGNSSAVMEQELKYASDFGIDFWAFVAYPPPSKMFYAQELYLQITDRTQSTRVKFCVGVGNATAVEPRAVDRSDCGWRMPSER